LYVVENCETDKRVQVLSGKGDCYMQ
jgi:hypothetical protein